MWKEHGTKILGGVTTALGAISAAPAVLTAIFGDYGPQVGALITSILGVATVLRGFTNSQQGASK
jgi:hypothetical protein